MMPEEQNMTDKQQIYSSDVLRVGYRDGAGNTTENSSIFSLIRMR